MSEQSMRQGGVLLHITSLPGEEYVGTLGKAARQFADFLQKSGMHVWQVLPVGPTGYGESPYQSACALAGNPNMIDLETLHEEGLLPDYVSPKAAETGYADFERLRETKDLELRKAYANAREGLIAENAFEAWQEKWPWLHDYALFVAIKLHFGNISWMEWPDQDIRLRRAEAMAKYESELIEEIRYQMFLQYLFRRQWDALRAYAHSRDIIILGDMPIYVAEDSSDVWANEEYFQLDEECHPRRVAGVPPDYFSEDGQLWGNPLYRWSHLKRHGYAFWMDRLRGMAQLFDRVRIDHFIGFANYYSVAAGAKNARKGRWIVGPGLDFFKKVKKDIPELNVVAEDLGAVNDRVRALLKGCGYPGMRVMQFGFDKDETNPHILKNHVKNCVAYTGTHDNDTTLGWWQAADKDLKWGVGEELGDVNDENIVDKMMEVVFMGPADTAVVPMWDVLKLGSERRMNTPGTVGGNNWRFRIAFADMCDENAKKLRALNEKSERL